MKTHLFIIILLLSLGLLYMSHQTREPYMDRYCNEHGNCKECLKTSGCAWCPLAKKCKLASSVKSEENCNSDNVVTALEQCKSDTDESFDEPSSENAKSKPPAVYTTSEADYSHQTVMGDVSKLREEVSHLQQELPDMIASTVQKALSSHPAPFHP